MSDNEKSEDINEVARQANQEYVALATSRKPYRGTPEEIQAAGQKSYQAHNRRQEQSSNKQSSAPWRKKK